MVRPLPFLDVHVSRRPRAQAACRIHTLAPCALEVDTCRSYQHIVDNREAAFAAHPLPSFGEDARIVKDGGLIEEDASTVNGARKWDFIGVEIVKGGFPLDLMWLVA